MNDLLKTGEMVAADHVGALAGLSMPRRFWAAVLAVLVAASSGLADPPWHPTPGDPDHAALLASITPVARAALGSPLEFRVIEMAVHHDRAFARLYATRPGGIEIDLGATPLLQDEGLSLDHVDGPRFAVFFVRRGSGWEIVTYDIGATDAWWLGYDCSNYGVFYPPGTCPD
ncbi:MAG: hypothetical protein AAF914_15380 [Pseudomonadota bacterium]